MNNIGAQPGVPHEKTLFLARHLLLSDRKGRWADPGCNSLVQETYFPAVKY